MIKLLPDLPDGVIGVEASGHVEADDYREVLGPALERALARPALGWMLPGEVKVCPPAEREQALAWVSAADAATGSGSAA
jgi:hypothetical protein